jgi:molybdopterin synthase sulfur carrier subunit
MMIICYFGALRERLGVKSEEFTDISQCQTAADIITILSARSERHAEAFRAINNICVAIDQEHADLSSPIDGAQEIARSKSRKTPSRQARPMKIFADPTMAQVAWACSSAVCAVVKTIS